MSGEQTGAPAPSRLAWIPGLALAGAAAAVAWLLHGLLPWAPWLTIALVLGVIVGCIPPARRALDGVLRAGLALAARRVLRIGIVVLGLQLSLVDIARLGWVAILLIVALVAAGFLVVYLLGRAFRLPGDEPVLLAAGFSICGVSAVGAMSAARRSDPADGGAPVAMVTLFGTAAVAILPVLALPFGLGHGRIYGDWVGASVHDVGQVVATAGTAGTAALAAAIVVKLTRVLMLAPMVAGASLVVRRRLGAPSTAVRVPNEGISRRPALVPLFVWGFLTAVLVNSFIRVPGPVLAAADAVQTVLLAAALFGLGTAVRFATLVRTGARSLAVGGLAWLLVAVLALLAVRLT
jgi:uncharacterized integral membrane protein (TIGR00698 family)